MLLKTLQFGEINIEKNQIIHFPKGILAFEENKDYVLIPIENNPIFNWLQSIDETSLAFLLVDPFFLKNDYYVEINDTIKEELQIDKPEDVVVYSLVTVPKAGLKKATTNLVAPLIINLKKMIASQVILDEPNGEIKYPLFHNNKNLKASSE